MKQSRGIKPIAYPAPVYIVGTYDAEGNPNMMAAAWGGICCSRPPSLCVSLRSATQSHGNIAARKAFTINIPSETYVAEADYAGLISGREVDKFAETGLTPVRAEYVDAPYVGEYPVVIECALSHTVELGLHTLFVGEVRDVKADEDVFDAQGKLDVTKIKPLIWAPDDRGYYGIGEKLGDAFAIGRALMNDQTEG
jgi:flavin reductase (DIM6/NTAB) family NADH-FMN oxidoreductase RutF